MRRLSRRYALVVAIIALSAYLKFGCCSTLPSPDTCIESRRSEEILRSDCLNKLILRLTFVDGARKAIPEEVVVNLKLVGQLGDHLSVTKKVGQRHEYLLNYHGKAAAGVDIKVKAEGFDEVNTTLPAWSEENIRDVEIMLVHERNYLRISSWEELSTTYQEIYRVLSAAGPGTAKKWYEHLRSVNSQKLINILDSLSFIEALNGNLSGVDSVDLEDVFNNDSLTLWVDLAVLASWDGRLDYIRRYDDIGGDKPRIVWRPSELTDINLSSRIGHIPIIIEFNRSPGGYYLSFGELWQLLHNEKILYNPPYFLERRQQVNFLEAVEDGNNAQIEAYLSGNNANTILNSYGAVAIEKAVKKKKYEVVKILLNKKISPRNISPLIDAIQDNEAEVAILLFDASTQLTRRHLNNILDLVCQRRMIGLVFRSLMEYPHAFRISDCIKKMGEGYERSDK